MKVTLKFIRDDHDNGTDLEFSEYDVLENYDSIFKHHYHHWYEPKKKT